MTKIEIHPTTIRRGYMAFVWARPRGEASYDIIQVFFSPRRVDAEMDAEQYREALKRGVLP